jgi:hypothetical protein
MLSKLSFPATMFERLTFPSPHFPIPDFKLPKPIPQTTSTMPDTAQINRSLSSIKTELEFLQASNVLSAPQFQSIMAQLPVRISRSLIPSEPACLRFLGPKWKSVSIHRPQILESAATVQPGTTRSAGPGSEQCCAPTES